MARGGLALTTHHESRRDIGCKEQRSEKHYSAGLFAEANQYPPDHSTVIWNEYRKGQLINCPGIIRSKLLKPCNSCSPPEGGPHRDKAGHRKQ